MRRLRILKQRAQLYLDYNGHCALCGIDLVKWHADHTIPFVLVKKTDYSNMQPLCPTCNFKKGKKVLTPKNKNYFDSIDLGKHIDISKFRIGQKGAFNCAVERVLNQEKITSLVIPTRYGKTDVMRSASIELVERGDLFGCLIAAPCKFLRDQVVQKNKINEMIDRYNIQVSKPITYDIMDSFRLPIFQNDEHFVALTTQMLSSNIDQICNYININSKKTGKGCAVFIDESHTSSDSNVWGAAIPKIESAGGYVLLLTATPHRDNGRIPGFDYVVEKEEEKIRHVPRQHEDPEKYYMDIYRDIEGQVKLNPNYEHTFKQAWEEENVICKVCRREYDVVVSIPDGNNQDSSQNLKTKEVKISEMSTSECRKYFGRVVRDEKVIQHGVKELVERLNDYRKHEPLAKGIVFCGNDIDDDIDDAHAKQITAQINRFNSEYEVVIATSKQENADDLIKSFGKGEGDILIVKQMASLGMDIPEIKIGLDLSAVRTLAAFVQRMMRTATIWKNNRVAHLITPSDVNGQALWSGFIEENGGAISTHETNLLDSVEKDKIEKDDKLNSFEVLRTENMVLSDTSSLNTLRVESDNDYKNFAQPLIEAQPKLQGTLSDTELIALGQVLGSDSLSRLKPIIVREKSIDITEKRNQIRNDIINFSKKIASFKFNYKTQKDQWIEENKTCLNTAKRMSGVNLRIKLNKITNIDTLVKMKDFLENQLLTIKK